MAQAINLDQQLISDIDLAILGTSQNVFDEYEQNIRKEYEWIDRDLFKKARKNLLERFLEQNTIYFLPYFQNRYEAAARKNLERSIQALDI